jgi:DNA-binding GntR family transcriptional regulator
MLTPLATSSSTAAHSSSTEAHGTPAPTPAAAAGTIGGPTLVDQLARDIQKRIDIGELPLGSWLRQESLAKDYSVSRTPIREALRKLQADRAVVLVRHRGALVRGQSPHEIREAYVVRAELEGLAAQLAAGRARPDDLQRLLDAEDLFRIAVKEFIDATAPANRSELLQAGTWDEANNRFHDAVIHAAGNERLRVTIDDLHRSIPRNLTWTSLSDEPSLIGENVQQHQRIREAIERRDAQAARHWMIDHIRRAGELVAGWFEYQDGSALAAPMSLELDTRPGPSDRQERLTHPS